jgi:hypothetical protein
MDADGGARPHAAKAMTARCLSPFGKIAAFTATVAS